MEQKTLSPVAGYDLVFSPPKSVSLLHALGYATRSRTRSTRHTSPPGRRHSVTSKSEACVTRRARTA